MQKPLLLACLQYPHNYYYYPQTHNEWGCSCASTPNPPMFPSPTLWLVSSFPMLLVQSGYADQDVFWASWQGFLPSFPGQVQRKTEEGDLRSCWDQSCAPWPQGPECEADGTQTLIQDSLSCLALLTLHLDISVYSFKNTFVLTSWKPKYIESFSRDVLPPSERGWEGEEFGQLTDVWKKSYQKAQSFVCLCMLGLWTKFSGCVHIRNNKFMCSSSINSNQYLISTNSNWAKREPQNSSPHITPHSS